MVVGIDDGLQIAQQVGSAVAGFMGEMAGPAVVDEAANAAGNDVEAGRRLQSRQEPGRVPE